MAMCSGRRARLSCWPRLWALACSSPSSCSLSFSLPSPVQHHPLPCMVCIACLPGGHHNRPFAVQDLFVDVAPAFLGRMPL